MRFIAKTVEAKESVVEIIIIYEADSQLAKVVEVDGVTKFDNELDKVARIADRSNIHRIISFL